MRHQTFHALPSLVATASVLAGCSGSGSSATGSSGSSSSGSSGGSGSSASGSATLTGSDAFTVRAAYSTFATLVGQTLLVPVLKGELMRWQFFESYPAAHLQTCKRALGDPGSPAQQVARARRAVVGPAHK